MDNLGSIVVSFSLTVCSGTVVNNTSGLGFFFCGRFFYLFYFIIHMCIQGLGHFSPLPPTPPLTPTPPKRCLNPDRKDE
jgi:hypothetical protein